jgi:hypothetical protein
MEHQLTNTLPDEVFLPLVETALNQGRTLEDVVVERVRAATPVNGARKKTDDIPGFSERGTMNALMLAWRVNMLTPTK